MKLAVTSCMLLVGIGCTDIVPVDDIYTLGDLACASTFGPEGAHWQSTTWGDAAAPGCEWHAFSARSTLTVEHPLGDPPAIVLVYVSFDASGRGATLASGDIALIDTVNDFEVTVRNNTNENFFARVVLQ